MCFQAHLGRLRPFFLGGLAIFGRFHEIFGLAHFLAEIGVGDRDCEEPDCDGNEGCVSHGFGFLWTSIIRTWDDKA
jgi:hypothetical protein